MDNQTFNFLAYFQIIDWVVVVLVLLGGLFAKRYLDDLNYIGKFHIGDALKTLFVATLFVGIYMVIQAITGQFKPEFLSKYFISYCFATSMYEIVLKKFFKFIGGDSPDNP